MLSLSLVQITFDESMNKQRQMLEETKPRSGLIAVTIDEDVGTRDKSSLVCNACGTTCEQHYDSNKLYTK